VLAVAVTILFVIIGVFVFMGISAKSIDTIYPNVTLYGVNLGGMTLEEAKTALQSSDVDLYAGKSVHVDFPANITLEIDAEQAGLCIDAEEEALRAYGYGRTSGFFSNTLQYILCMISPRTLESDILSKIDESYIRERIAETTRTVNAELLENSLKIDQDKITIIKGLGSVLVDDDEVYRLIRDAFTQKAYESISYTPPTEAPEEINLEDIKKVVFVEMKNAEYDEAFQVSDEAVGVSFDEAEAQRMLDKAEPGDKIVIPLIFTQPEFTKEYLESLIFRDVLYAKTTYLTSNETRSKNIELAAKEVDGTILFPGDEFSFNDTVGQRTADKGYGAAPAYLNGEVVMEIGGGICQVSSTIYYCCLYADLEIVYRTYHMYPAAYLPLGMDATVSWGGPDYKFKNNTDYPIKIHSWRDGNTLTVELYGTKLDENYISMEYVVTEVVPYKTIYKENDAIAPGEIKLDQHGSNGFVVNTYKYRYDGEGNLISKTYEDYSSYTPHHEIFLVAPGEADLHVSPSPGTVTPTPAETPSPEPTPDLSPTPTADPEASPTPTTDPDSTPTPTSPETEDPSPTPETTPTLNTDPEETPEPTDGA
jgi:vancomycin resistance protein YoaR